MIKNASFKCSEGGIRLDAALCLQYPASTRAFCREACAEGLVAVNGKPAIKGLKLRAGDLVEVAELAEAADNRAAPDPATPVKCIFEDPALLAFDKPCAMPVHPLSRKETGTLMNGAVARWPELAAIGDTPLAAGAVHRIDADTSGLVLAARTQTAFENLRAQFAAHSVRKTYLALVEGAVAAGGTLENNLVHDPTLPFCRMIDVSRARAKIRTAPMKAITNYRAIGRTMCGNEERTLLEVTIFTGVTHQIRAQLAMAGMHIVNDRLYGAFAVENQRGHCLHSLAAKFTHPISGEAAEIRTAFPEWAEGVS